MANLADLLGIRLITLGGGGQTLVNEAPGMEICSNWLLIARQTKTLPNSTQLATFANLAVPSSGICHIGIYKNIWHSPIDIYRIFGTVLLIFTEYLAQSY